VKLPFNAKPPSTAAPIAAAVVLTSILVATWVAWRARAAEHRHPPDGKFVTIDGVRLHYVERGRGPAVVLIHGNAVSSRDFIASGLVDKLAVSNRVLVFDRPGFGHSRRPRDRLWTPAAQADLIWQALDRLGVEQAALVGHSMGTMVASAMAVDQPNRTRALVVAGGYFYPRLRMDALLTAPVALPLLGDVMRYTVTALSSRALLGGAVKTMFAPNDVPIDFFPLLQREMLVRPLQLRANAEDAAFMMPAAFSLSESYGALRMPVTIIAGEDDGVVDVDSQSARLHAALPNSTLNVISGTGHMVHYTAHDSIVSAAA
jgi:pimeloyl-ACP methyl ester carboxylesterase